MSNKIEIIDPTAKLPEIRKSGGGVKFSMYDAAEVEVLSKAETGESLEKSLTNSMSAIRGGSSVTQLAFKEDPVNRSYYNSLWVHKRLLCPDELLKRIALTDSLVAAILAVRSNHLSAFGRKLEDRFSTGFRIEPRRGVMQKADTDTKEALQKRIDAAEKKMAACGSEYGWDDDDRMNLSTFLHQQCRNGILFGRFATEVVTIQGLDGEKKFHSFRPVDAGTIYRAVPNRDADVKLRQQALRQLEKIKGEKLVPERFTNDEYSWIQVIQNQPRQAFTSKELIVHNIYTTTDYELLGYPVTPIDTALSETCTHMNITQMNKLYFQNGRAARGMVIIKSADVTQDIIAQIRQHFQASINSVNNSFRVPIFGIEPTDEITWQPLEAQGGRDQEFQYLSDANARSLCAAFQISPEEIPGYQHLSRGTNNRSLSEGDNEYILEAHRDIGIRPLLAQFQDFLNTRILPLIDPGLVEHCTLKLYGLDSDSAEKESTRLAQDLPLHGTMDEALERTEKDPLGKRWGGTFPLNPSWQAAVAPYLTAGELREKFFGIEGASKDPKWDFCRDPMWIQWQQMQMQAQQAQQQTQMQQQQPQTGAPPPDGSSQGQGQAQEDPQQQGQDSGDSEIANGADQVLQALGKSELNLPPNRRRLVTQHKKIVDTLMGEWERESKQALREIVNSVKKK